MLVIVLVFALLLTAAVTTFLRRAAVDTLIARNRESMARAEALARGGVRLGTALLIEDRLLDAEAGGSQNDLVEDADEEEAESDAEPGLGLDTLDERWARIQNVEIETESGGKLRLQLEDAGARLNINAVFTPNEDGELSDRVQPFLIALLEKVIDEMQGPAHEKLYEVRDLADNLIDYVDDDDLRQGGGPEDEYYQEQKPPYRAANRPVLSIDELRLVEGFDGPLVEALEPYLTVHPYAGGYGVNLNTAPPHVLALLFYDDGVDMRLAKEDVVERILKVRKEGGIVCQGQSAEGCTPIEEIVTNSNTIHPPPGFVSDVFTVMAEARVGDARRTVEAVVDRGQGAQPLLLSWRVR